MLNLKEYGSSSDDEDPSKNTSPETPFDDSISVLKLNEKFAVNAAPNVLPPVSF